jgi:putative GTP pyrophosphokinase
METILNKYDDTVKILRELKDRVELLLIDLMKVNSVNIHQITSRLKTRDSLTKKISRKQGYTCLEDITDIVGCRIITYFEDEVDKIASIIEEEFEKDIDNSVDKRKIEFDRFGYLSLHYVVKLNSKRLRLSEFKRFKEIKFEIQIRSILQHGWAEIEHDIGYKGELSIPNVVKRRFSRIAALLETADIEFVRLRDELIQYEKNIKKKIASDPSKVNIDKASLISFITNNKDLKKADTAVAGYFNLTLKDGKYPVEDRIALLQFGGIYSVYDLEQLFSNNLNCIIDYSKHWRGANKRNTTGFGVIGISIYDAAYFQISRTKSEKEFISFFNGRFGKKGGNLEAQVKRCYESLKKVDKHCLQT